MRIGVIGLGAGTIAAYGRPGDYIRYYEINPADIEIATDSGGYFTFVRDSHAQLDIIPGDARLSMEDELRTGRAQQFNILVLDAFSGDAIPIHLLTAEAFSIYLRELQADGVLAVHISNSYLDLRPVVATLADHFRLDWAWVHSKPDGRMYTESNWMLVARDANLLSQPDIAAGLQPTPTLRKVRLWTDDYSNLFQILK